MYRRLPILRAWQHTQVVHGGTNDVLVRLQTAPINTTNRTAIIVIIAIRSQLAAILPVG